MSASSNSVLLGNAEIIVSTFRGVFLGSLHINTENLAIDVIKNIESTTGLPWQELRILYNGKHLSTDSSALREAAKDWIAKGELYRLPINNAPDFYLWAFKPRRLAVLGPAPLIFLISDGERAGEVLIMNFVTSETTIQDVLHWISHDAGNKEEDVVAFFLRDFGLSEYIPIHDKQPCFPRYFCGSIICELNKHATKVRGLFDNPVYISMKKHGWNSGKEGVKKLTIQLNLSLESRGSALGAGDSSSSEYSPSLGVRFVDLAETKVSVDGAEPSMTSQCWSSKAPKWPWAERGLSLEGRCTNFSCKAHGSMVIVNKGVNDFDLTLNYNDCHCPLCGRPVIPEKPGFNNCLWRIEAAKFDSRSRFCTSWTRTKDEYWTYDLAARGRAIFSRLQIFVRELTDAPRVSAPVANSCMIYFKSMGREPQFQLSCMRIIHHVCSKKWAQVQRTMNCELPCPACEGPHLCADDIVEEIKATRIVDIGENAVGLRK